MALTLKPCAAAALLMLAALQAGPVAAADDPSLPYAVQPRDTMIGLGRQMLQPPSAWREVAQINRLRNQNLILPGQTLKIPLRLLRSTEVPARIEGAEGDVRLGAAPARAGNELAAGQSLTTGAGSSAIVRLGDGSRIKLAPASELAVGEHRRFELKAGTPQAPGTTQEEGLFASTMRLVRGSIEVLATKVFRAKPLEVQTPTAVIGVRGTDYRVHHDATAANPTRTEVLEGRVRADLGAAGETATAPTTAAPLGADVAAGFGAALRTGQAPVVAALLPAPDLSGLLPRYERPLVRLALPPAPQPQRVQVAADAAFDRLVFDERLPAGAAEARIAGLADGPWFVRVRRIDPAGIEGYDASRPFTLKARPEPPATLQPQVRQKLPVGSVTLAWAENLEAARYRLQVARDPAFTQMVQQADGQTGAQAAVTVAEPGTYHWRLASVRPDGDTGPWGDARSFEARPLPEPPVGGAGADGKTLEISWSGRDEDKHQVELARDGQFNDVLHRDELKATHWSLPMPAPGTYYFRYRSVEPDGFVSPWSSTLRLEAPRGWGFLWLLAPWLLAL